MMTVLELVCCWVLQCRQSSLDDVSKNASSKGTILRKLQLNKSTCMCWRAVTDKNNQSYDPNAQHWSLQI
ncbi:unnamed protein product [Sphagnum compactum]